jgi:hypothetical protein
MLMEYRPAPSAVVGGRNMEPGSNQYFERHEFSMEVMIQVKQIIKASCSKPEKIKEGPQK